MTTTAPPSVKHPYVTQEAQTCGGKPIIAGTRIRVAQIALEYEVMGWTADEILQAHPHLTLAQIHAALSYYYENITEIQADMRAGQTRVETLRQQHPVSVLKEKRVGR